MPKKQKHEPAAEPEEAQPLEAAPEKSVGGRRWKLRLPPQTRSRRIFALTGLVVAIALLWLAIPYSRYGLLGQFIKRPAVIKVTDSRTHKPVSDVLITLGSQKARTDANGEVKLSKVPVGGWQVQANKKYYNLLTTDVMVPVFGPGKTFTLSLTAIGNQVTIKVTNKITGKALAKATVSALGTTATTDTSGEAVLVLPVDKAKVDGTVKLTGYNDRPVSIVNSEDQATGNAFALVPSGKIYYLDKRTGVINVMKSDLDGSNPSVVVTGTGRESDTDTVLISTRDWRYLALKSQRDSGSAKLYLITTSSDKMSLIDQGNNITFTLTGWYDHYLVYKVSRHDATGQVTSITVKSYNAESDHIASLANSDNANTQYISDPAFLGEKVIFTVTGNGQPSTIRAISPDGSGGATLKTLTQGQSFGELKVAKPDLFYFGIYAWPSQPKYYQEDSDGKTTEETVLPGLTDNTPLPYYLLSPDEKHTFWYEPRDGKNSLFVGNAAGDNGNEIASLSDYKPYGWYTENYVLISKSDSELYIAPADFSSAPVKITDYHKPSVTFNGYGGGYGGQ